MGKGSKPTIGFWYHVAFHHGLTIGPIDAFLEFRGGDKTAWSGELTASGTIHVNAPMLWGGEKDQGGIVGDLDVMFGEPTQTPNPYLVSTFGNQTAAWRGFATVAFKGGRYGAMNPYPQKPSYKFRQITSHWDDPGCWYPEKAQIALVPSTVFVADLAFPATAAGVGPYAGVTIDSGFTATDILVIEKLPGMTYRAWSHFLTDDAAEALGLPWGNEFNVTNNTTGVTTKYWGSGTPGGAGMYATIAEAEAAALGKYVLLTGGTSYTIWLEDTPVSDNRGGMSLKVSKGGLFGINPAHVLYYSRTNSEMGRESRASINDASLRAAADKLYTEGFGICPDWDPASESVEDFEKRICKLIGGSFTRSLEDGQWYLDLARGDYVLADLPILTDDDILDFKEQPAVLDNAVNSVSVSYRDPEKKETIVTPPVRAMALVAAFGTIHQTTSYPSIPTGDLATRIAQRDMLASATPTRAFDLATMHVAWNWRPNQYFRLQAPKRGIADMVCIIGDHQAGTLKSGAIKMKVAQDTFAMPTTSFVQVEPGVDTRPPQTPTAITTQRAIEAPYVEIAAMLTRADLAALPVDVGYAMAVAAKPPGDLDYSMMVQAAGGDYVDAGRGEWCATAVVNEAAGYTDTAFILGASSGLAAVQVGMGVLWDDEIARVDAIDLDAGTITLARGCADTVPHTHAASSRVWFYATGFAYDVTEFTDGETANVKLLGNTGSQQYPLDTATALPVSFAGRQGRPYPPGKLTINTQAYPITITGDLQLAWAHRDRVLQADQLVDTTQADIGPEVGATATVRVYDENDALLHTEAGLSGTSFDYLAEITDAGGTLGDADYANVTALLHMQGVNGGTSFPDVKGTTWSPSGSPVTSTAQFKWGNSSGSFSGSSGWLIASDPSIGNFLGGDFTVEGWVYPKASGGTQHIVGTYGNSDGRSWMLGISGTAILCAWSVSGSYEPSRDKGVAGVITIGAWQHVAMVRSGTNLYAFVNGNLKGTFAIGSDVLATTIGKAMKIGGNSEAQWLNAYLQDVRLTKSKARYTSNFTPPGATFPEVLPAGRLNGRLRIELESTRDALASFQRHNVTVERPGYGFNYGKYYGGV